MSVRHVIGPMVVLVGGLAVAAVVHRVRRGFPIGWSGAPPPLVDPAAAARADAAWNAERAVADVAALIAHAPRSPGTPGQAATIAYIETQLAATGFRTERQAFTWHRDDGATISLVNLVARFQPEAPTRILLGTHHDSLVRAYRDRARPLAPMPGANNSASGVAVLLETARALGASGEGAPTHVGIDLVFFDGEEGPYALGAGDPHWQALGSTEFVRRIGDFYDRPPASVVILDLVCRPGLRLQPEANSLRVGRAELAQVWRIGRVVAPGAFSWRGRGGIGDDHTAFWRAGIPAILLADLRPADWFNTTGDTLDQCRADSLAAVGRTLVRYLHAAR